MKSLIALSLICLALTGCATAQRLGNEAFRRGDFPTAEAHFRSAVRDGNKDALADLGVALERQGKTAQAFEAYKMAARWGDPNARKILARRGVALPPMDLYLESLRATTPPPVTTAPASTEGLAALLGILNSVQEGKNTARSQALQQWNSPASISCESRDTSMGGMNGTIYTTCR